MKFRGPILHLSALLFSVSIAANALAGFLSPLQFLSHAKQSIALNEKVVALRSLINLFPTDSAAVKARQDLISLLAETNRVEEAFQEYQGMKRPGRADAGLAHEGVDFVYLDYLLYTGRYGQLLRETSVVPPGHDFLRDERLMELRVQALLAQGRFFIARQAVEQFLEVYAEDGTEGSRFEGDVRSIQFLERHLRTLERSQGPAGKPIFTASVPDSLRSWSRRHDVPVVFYKLIPAHPAGQLHEPMFRGSLEGDEVFRDQVAELNRGFSYLSGGKFGVKFGGVHTLYVKEGGVDPADLGGRLLTGRVYLHTIAPLYKLAGKAYVILIDYRQTAESDASYMGDGLIHLSAGHFDSMILMHEILHGLGATHQEWDGLQSKGYQFDPDDRGIMTFSPGGRLKDFGLEEKNRAVLGWPRVPVIHLTSETAQLPIENHLLLEAQGPQDTDLVPS